MIKKLIRKIISKGGRFLCRHRGNAFVEYIYVEVSLFVRDLDNLNWDMETNGELRVLKCIELISPKCVFDVGANVGEWSILLSNMYPECEIHSFEIVPATYARLVDATKGNSKVIANNVGLSDEAGKIIISLSNTDSTVATSCRIKGMEYHNNFYNSEIECEVSTGLQYINNLSIENIDYLKVDVEGMDLKVLKGFEDKLLLARVIQFEYGIFNISSHDLLSDFCLFLEDRGYIVGKVYPTHVNFFKYHFEYEDFGGNNYLAIRSNESELIARLSTRSN